MGSTETMRQRAQDYDDRDVTAWRPGVGDVVAGTIIDLDTRATEYDPAVPVLTLETADGLTDVWAFHTVLRSELQKLAPQRGQEIAIRRLADSERGYMRYRVFTDVEDAKPFAWGEVDVDGGDVDPEDRVSLFEQHDDDPL